MSKHTPGPWLVATEFISKVEVITKQNDRIALITSGEMTRLIPFEEKLANSELIAAAPELLEACKRALLGFENTPPVCNEDRYEPMMVLIAAIAKAEGKS